MSTMYPSERDEQQWAMDDMHTAAQKRIAELEAAHAADHAALQRLQAEVDKLRRWQRAENDDEPDWTPEKKAEMQAEFDAFVAERAERDAKVARCEAAEAAVQRLQQENERLQQALAQAISALPDSETAGPDGDGYQYAWDELTGDEQEWVKEIRDRVARLQSSTPQESQ